MCFTISNGLEKKNGSIMARLDKNCQVPIRTTKTDSCKLKFRTRSFIALLRISSFRETTSTLVELGREFVCVLITDHHLVFQIFPNLFVDSHKSRIKTYF